MLQNVKETQQLIVIAHYPDGTTRDVTRDAIFDTSNFEVAIVGKSGQVEAVRRGEAAALVRYEGQYAVAPVTVIGTRDGYAWKASPEFNFVDKHVERQAPEDEALGVGPLLRRRIPAPHFARPDRLAAEPRADAGLLRRPARLPHQAPGKRSRSCSPAPPTSTIGRSSGATCLLNKRKYVTEKGVWAFRNWIRQSLMADKPYDKFVYDLMTASGHSLENPAVQLLPHRPRAERRHGEHDAGLSWHSLQLQQVPRPSVRALDPAAVLRTVGLLLGGRAAPGASADDEIVYTLRAPEAVINPRTNTAVNAVFPVSRTPGWTSARMTAAPSWPTG